MTLLDLEERERFMLLRRREGLRQAEVAAKASLSRSALSRWEYGQLELDAERVTALWQALDVLSSSSGAA